MLLGQNNILLYNFSETINNLKSVNFNEIYTRNILHKMEKWFDSLPIALIKNYFLSLCSWISLEFLKGL